MPDAGPPPDYCTEIRPILQASCLGTCHGSQNGYPNSPTDFRLDYYERPAPAAPGAKEKALRIKDRIYDRRDMPPLNELIVFVTTDAQRAQVNTWVKMGAPLGAGTCELDAGVDPPKADAGALDGGVDAGVRFSTDIQPILQMRCGGANGNCHFAAMPAAGMSLTAANAYRSLAGDGGVTGAPTAGCNAQVRRVVPGSTAQSMLWRKLSNDGTKCGNAMPNNTAGLATVDATQFQRIVQWINQGAPNN